MARTNEIEVCERCGRPVLSPWNSRNQHGTSLHGDQGHGPWTRVYVQHAYYGCDTGCCGHVRVIEGPNGREQEFDFGHPYSLGFTPGIDREEWIREFIGSWGQHVPIDWDACQVSDD